MWSFPIGVRAPGRQARGVLVYVSEVLVTKLFLGKNTLNPPSSFDKDRPSAGEMKFVQ